MSLYPQKQTCAAQHVMSALCQKRTSLEMLHGLQTRAECARLLHGSSAAAPGHRHLRFCGHSRAAIFLEGGVELG